MALRDCGESPEMCDALMTDLNDWIAYILLKKVSLLLLKILLDFVFIIQYQVKLGKKVLRPVIGLSEMKPIEAVSAHLVNYFYFQIFASDCYSTVQNSRPDI